MDRPRCDIVVPFAGTSSALGALLRRLRELRVREGDTLTVVDNRPSPAASGSPSGIALVPAPRVRSSYYARNIGAARGTAPWLVFVDADVEAPSDLLDAYFEPPPNERVGVLGGGIVDAPADGRSTAASRYAIRHGMLSLESTRREGASYAKTANCAVRREAFEQVGGFAIVRSGGDADLCFRIQRAGWSIGWREQAVVHHRSRASVAGLLRQSARHGAGTEWLERRYPGFLPRGSRLGVARWLVAEAVRVAPLLPRGRDEALSRLLEPLAQAAFEVGRSLPNRARRAG